MVHVEEKTRNKKKISQKYCSLDYTYLYFKYCCACITEDQPTYNGYNGKKTSQ